MELPKKKVMIEIVVKLLVVAVVVFGVYKFGEMNKDRVLFAVTKGEYQDTCMQSYSKALKSPLLQPVINSEK